jgi:integrase
MSTQGQVITLARYYARQAVLLELRGQGIKLHHVDACEITRSANRYIVDHPEIIAFATERYEDFVKRGARDHLLFLMMYRHGSRCSEAVDLRIEDVSFDRATLWVKRLKGSNSGTHPIEGDERSGVISGFGKNNLPWLFLSERRGG